MGYVYTNDLNPVMACIDGNEVFYNASYKLSDGINIESIVNLLKSIFRLWLGVTEWLRDLVSKLKPLS